MRISIHQPEHMPWLGFFHKMASCDVFVLLDNVQFKKNNWQNRNRIVERDGSLVWLTVPVLIKGHMETTIKEIRINNEISWRRKYWGKLHGAYCKHPFYDENQKVLEEIILGEDAFLRNLNYKLILFFRDVLGIKTKILWASELDITGKSTELLVNICKALGAKEYLSGPGGKDYLETPLFEKENIALKFHEFMHPVYESVNYRPNLSCLDLVMNHGQKSGFLLGIE